MELQKIELLEFDTAIAKLEDEAILPVRRKCVGFLRPAAGVVGTMGAMCFFISLGVLSLAAFSNPVIVVAGGVFGIIAALVGSMLAITRYCPEFPFTKPHLKALLGPEARDFTLANWERREHLLKEASAYNRALRAMKKALPERAGTDEVDEGVAVNFAQRRKKLEAEFAAYENDFRTAAAEDIRRVKELKEKQVNPLVSKPVSKRGRLKAFRIRARRLKELEKALDGLNDSVEAGLTVDLSPYVAAQRLRSELEEERAELVAEGLKPKKLTAPNAKPSKLLAASVG